MKGQLKAKVNGEAFSAEALCFTERGQAENCETDKWVMCFEGSCSALRSAAFSSAIDSSTHTPHAEWESMLSGGCEPPQPLTHLQASHTSTQSNYNFFDFAR